MKSLIALILIACASVGQAEGLGQDGVAILKEQSNGNYLLGRTYLDESDANSTDSDNDTFALPECNGGANEFFDGIRMRANATKPNGAANLDSLIKKVVIVFGNGQALTTTFNKVQGYLKVTKNAGDGLTIKFATPRCVRAISVIGEQYEAGNKNNPAMVDVVGVYLGDR